MTDIVDSDVIRLAKWHENEAVRLRKHPDADMASTHGLAEMHGETASTLYMLLADRNAAIMDADMQAREAGNMEYNARVLMTERDTLRVALMPFALAAPLDLNPEMDDQYVDTSSDMLYDLTYGYFRKARIALGKDR
jgi:DNA-binding protein Fis